MNPIILWSITILLFLLGLLGNILPFLPGAIVIFAGALFYAFFTNFEKVEISTLAILGAIAILSYIFDYLAGIYGVKKMGGGKWGMIGAIMGGILGIAGGILGMALGAFVGAVAAEFFLARKNFNQSAKIGLGSALGFLSGALAGVIFSILMIIFFLAAVFF